MSIREVSDRSTESDSTVIDGNDDAIVANLVETVDAFLVESQSQLDEIAQQLNRQRSGTTQNAPNHSTLDPNLVGNHRVSPSNGHHHSFVSVSQNYNDYMGARTIDTSTSESVNGLNTSTDASEPSDRANTILQKRYTFPHALYQLLDDTIGHTIITDIISWNDNGRSFRVHDRQRFVLKVLPKYFEQTKYTSFTRQLQLYGFERIKNNDPYNGSYYHERFLRGQRHLVDKIRRQVVRRKKRSRLSFSPPEQTNS
jgi:HSF-type DNA-binding